MPRYYFDMRHEDEIATVEEGLELPTIESVQEEAAPPPPATSPGRESAKVLLREGLCDD